jgi:hypothetical protein
MWAMIEKFRMFCWSTTACFDLYYAAALRRRRFSARGDA